MGWPEAERWGILSDRAIREAVAASEIRIDPFDGAHLNPASYDLTLGDEVTVYDGWVDVAGEPHREDTDGSRLFLRNATYDVRQEPVAVKFRMGRERGWVLKPGIGYLMHTHERIWTERFVPVLDGKSSIGRLFLQVHVTAGYGDPGFDGQYTLEVIATHPVRIFPGMRIAQIRFHTIDSGGDEFRGVEKPYNRVGHYTGDHARGAVPSQAWRQFKGD